MRDPGIGFSKTAELCLNTCRLPRVAGGTL
jgi:hypothetical protein